MMFRQVACTALVINFLLVVREGSCSWRRIADKNCPGAEKPTCQDIVVCQELVARDTHRGWGCISAKSIVHTDPGGSGQVTGNPDIPGSNKPGSQPPLDDATPGGGKPDPAQNTTTVVVPGSVPPAAGGSTTTNGTTTSMAPT